MATGRKSNYTRLKSLCEEAVKPRGLILASNRGPFEYEVTPEGRLQARRNSGGALGALTTLSQMLEMTWVSPAP